MIWLGPAGIPTVSKDSSTLVGIEVVSELKLNAMEIEFVRGVKMSNELAKECGKVAKELNIKLSVHAPYFINLSSAEKLKIKQSKKRILDSVERAHLMNADVIVFHPGYYGKLSPEETYEMIKEGCEDLVDIIKSKGWNVRLGLETTGKLSQFGTLDEIIRIHKKLKLCVPVVDFSHMLARQQGKIDYGKILNKLKALKLKHYHTHFSGIEFSEKGERRHLTIDNEQPPFKPLAKEILKKKINITIISESPVLEQDSLIMKKTFEELGYKF